MRLNFLTYFFLGDLSYGDCMGRLWDSYGEMIESVSSSRPWMVGPGNHEIEQIYVDEIGADGKLNSRRNNCNCFRFFTF